MTVQDIILTLTNYWKEKGCYVAPTYDLEVGAGTMSPHTIFRVLGEKPYRVVYVQPSRRPTDGRYGENPNRVQKHFQLQVILKPAPEDGQKLYIESLESLGIDLKDNFLSFEEDNWQSPTLGAWGVGWQVMLNGLEVTQFTYFQQAGGVELNPVSLEITYGIERLALFLAKKDDIYELDWSDDISYRDLRMKEEIQFSEYNFKEADIEHLKTMFNMYESEISNLIGKNLYLPAYDLALKLSHIFNLLDARRALSITQRQERILSIRNYVKEIARIYLEEIDNG
jgi:glycyl-tRNA synthetase alpha chain